MQYLNGGQKQVDILQQQSRLSLGRRMIRTTYLRASSICLATIQGTLQYAPRYDANCDYQTMI
jgi:hypothetical protein